MVDPPCSIASKSTARALSTINSQRFLEILDEEPETDAPDAKELENVEGVIEFKDVSFQYEQTKEEIQG